MMTPDSVPSSLYRSSLAYYQLAIAGSFPPEPVHGLRIVAPAAVAQLHWSCRGPPPRSLPGLGVAR